MSDVQHLSPEAHRRLQEEHEDLTTRGRVEVAQRIEAARALGDLSENGDYHAAKDDQGKMEARIRHIEAMLKNAQIVEQASVVSEVVVAGSIVTIRYEGEEDVERYLVGSIEEKPAGLDGVVSPGSPLGAELMGKRAGEMAEFEVKGNRMKVEIVEIGS